MKKEDIFEALVKYHIEHDLEEVRPYMANGRMQDPHGKEIVEGVYDAPYSGFLIIADGSSTIDDLVREGVISRLGIKEPVPIKTEDDLFKCLTKNGDEDGAFTYAQGNLIKVPIVNNYIREIGELGDSMYNLLPEDFVSFDRSRPVKGNIGTKTLTGMIVPQVCSYLQSFVIKRSSYGDTGLGKVVHFNTDGLAEEFFFAHERSEGSGKSLYVPRIVGVYREYHGRDKSDRNERIIDISQDHSRLPYAA